MATQQAATASLPKLTDKDIRKFTDPASFSRGEGYYRRGMIYHPIRRGETLAASCHGSSGGPYEVRLTLSPIGKQKIESWSCTCPLGTFCKHVVALGLTWIANPERFEAKPSIDEILAEQDRAGLIAIIQRFLAIVPSLEAALERIIPPAPLEIAPAGPGDAAKVTVDVRAIRRKLDQALDANTGETDYEDSSEFFGFLSDYLSEEVSIEEVDAAFEEAIAIAERYEQAGRYADATVVFALVGSVGTDRFDDAFESEVVFEQIFAAGRGLVRCLERQNALPEDDRLHQQERNELIDTIYEIWCFAGHGHWGDADGHGVPQTDAEVADLVLSEPDVITLVAAQLTGAERQKLEDDWRSEAANTGIEEWRRRSAITFGITLNGTGGLSEEETLELITAAELWWDQAMFLLNQGKIDEATAVATRKLTTPQSALQFANVLAGRGEDGPERAIRFVDERLWETEGKVPVNDVVYLTWLADAYAANGKPDEALSARLRVFKLSPHFGSYTELEALAKESGVDPERWSGIRADALKLLSEKGNSAAVMEIYLAEGNVREALALLDQPTPARPPKPAFPFTADAFAWSYGVTSYREQVAQLAERELPDEAIRIYRQLVDQLIAQKNRNSYAAAAGHLAAIKRVLDANGRGEEWQKLIRTIRQENPKLRALQDELDQAGL